MMDLIRELPRLAEKLERHGMDVPLDMIDIDGDAAPCALVDLRHRLVLDVFHRALRALLDAEAAHTACCRHLYLAVMFHHRAERADGNQFLHIINLVLMNN